MSRFFPSQFSTENGQRGRTLLGFVGAEARARLVQLIESRSPDPIFFDIDLEVASAMGSVWFTMLGTRMPGPAGVTERLTGVMREVTERRRETQRLRYLATRDELTGHLNRNALRTELAEAIRKAQVGGAQLRLPGRLDRPPGDDQRHLRLRRRRRSDRRRGRAAVAHAALAPT